MKKEQKFPPGWDEKRLKEVIAHYENQTEVEEAAEMEAALKAENTTLMDNPTELDLHQRTPAYSIEEAMAFLEKHK